MGLAATDAFSHEGPGRLSSPTSEGTYRLADRWPRSLTHRPCLHTRQRSERALCCNAPEDLVPGTRCALCISNLGCARRGGDACKWRVVDDLIVPSTIGVAAAAEGVGGSVCIARPRERGARPRGHGQKIKWRQKRGRCIQWVLLNASLRVLHLAVPTKPRIGVKSHGRCRLKNQSRKRLEIEEASKPRSITQTQRGDADVAATQRDATISCLPCDEAPLCRNLPPLLREAFAGGAVDCRHFA